MLFFKAIIGHELIKTQGNQIAFTDKKNSIWQKLYSIFIFHFLPF